MSDCFQQIKIIEQLSWNKKKPEISEKQPIQREKPTNLDKGVSKKTSMQRLKKTSRDGESQISKKEPG